MKPRKPLLGTPHPDTHAPMRQCKKPSSEAGCKGELVKGQGPDSKSVGADSVSPDNIDNVSPDNIDNVSPDNTSIKHSPQKHSASKPSIAPPTTLWELVESCNSRCGPIAFTSRTDRPSQSSRSLPLRKSSRSTELPIPPPSLRTIAEPSFVPFEPRFAKLFSGDQGTSPTALTDAPQLLDEDTSRLESLIKDSSLVSPCSLSTPTPPHEPKAAEGLRMETIQTPHEPPLRRHDCLHYETCLDIAAALDWESFTCAGCRGEIDQQLLWRARNAMKKDPVARSCCHLPEVTISGPTGHNTFTDQRSMGSRQASQRASKK